MIYYYATTYVHTDTGKRIMGGYSESINLYEAGTVIDQWNGDKIIIEFRFDDKPEF